MYFRNKPEDGDQYCTQNIV